MKVGGSLFDWPELIPRLRAFVEPLQKNKIFLFPGGGPLTDVIREYDRVHQLGEERSHWLAIKTLQINSLLLSAIFPEWRLITTHEQLSQRGNGILDPFPLCECEPQHSDLIPASWQVTSDSISLRFAQVANASRLILLKSTNLPDGLSWSEAAEQGFVDAHFPKLFEIKPIPIEWVNLRAS